MRELDRAIIRLAVGEAKDHMRKGSTPEEAAAIATRGVWKEYRQQVLFELVGYCTAPKIQIREPVRAEKRPESNNSYVSIRNLSQKTRK